MSANEDEVGRLWRQFLEVYYTPEGLPKARQLAEQLATALGEYDREGPDKAHVHPWILVWEARGNLPEAIRLAEHDLAGKRAELEAGDFDPYPRLLLETVEYLCGGLTFQAERYVKIGNKEKARACLGEVSALCERYGIQPDEDAQALFRQVNEGE